MLSAVLLALALAPAAGGETGYLVREGDTLFGISRALQVPVAILQSYNGIADAGRIKPGMTIRVPASHVVQKGETLFGIARSVGVTVDQLCSLNGARADAVIKPGDRLYLPAGSVVAAEPAVRGSTPPARTAAGRWPLPGAREPWAPLKGIIGVAIEGKRGDGVVSVTDGEVNYAGRYANYGEVVIVTTADGHHLMYAGNEELLVRKGDHVRPGMEIARLGVSPRDNRARLYFSVQGRVYEYVDPEKYLGSG